MEGVSDEEAPAAAAGEDSCRDLVSTTVLSLLLLSVTVPSRPDPPVVGKVTHNSIELYWSESAADSPAHAAGPLVYTVQESGLAGSAGVGTVYQ